MVAAVAMMIAGLGCCIGCQLPILAICWRLRRRRNKHQAPRKESDLDQSVPKPDKHDQAQIGHADHEHVVKDKKLRWLLPEAPSPPTEEHHQVAPALPAPVEVSVASGLVVGSVVELQDSRAKLDLNGRRGRVIEWMPKLQRYVIEFADGTRESVWPINLLLVEAEPTDDVQFDIIQPQPPMTVPTRGALAMVAPSPVDDFLELTCPSMVQPRSVVPPSLDDFHLDVTALKPTVPPSNSCLLMKG
jgi:hypothetical protein